MNTAAQGTDWPIRARAPVILTNHTVLN